MGPPVTARAVLATVLVVAEVGAGTLLRALALALVLVAPYFLLTRRRVRAGRAALAAEVGADDGDDADAPGAPGALETVVATIGALAGAVPDGVRTRVEVPDGATVDGRPVPATVRDAVLADALARSGLTEVARHEDGGRLVLEVVPVRPRA